MNLRTLNLGRLGRFSWTVSLGRGQFSLDVQHHPWRPADHWQKLRDEATAEWEALPPEERAKEDRQWAEWEEGQKRPCGDCPLRPDELRAKAAEGA